MMATHADSELLPGAMENMLQNYERIKDTKWGILFGSHGGHIFSLTNIAFHVNENFWYDVNLLPFYYMDNLAYRVMQLRGYSTPTCESPTQLVNHVSSHYIRGNPVYKKRNDITFPGYGQIYINTWGGLPGQEKVSDPTVYGMYPLNPEPSWWNKHWEGV